MRCFGGWTDRNETFICSPSHLRMKVVYGSQLYSAFALGSASRRTILSTLHDHHVLNYSDTGVGRSAIYYSIGAERKVINKIYV